MDCLLFRPFYSHIRRQVKTKRPSRVRRSFRIGANDGNRSALAIIITAHIWGLTSVPHIGALLALSRRGGQTVLMDCLLFRPFDSHIRRQMKTKRPSRVRRSLCGANDGNRTHNRSLGSCCFTTKLHSRDCVCRFRLIRVTARIACLRPRSRSLSLRQRVTRGDMCTAAAAPGARHRAATSRTVILAYLRERSTVFGKYSRGSVKDMRLYARD